MGTSEPHTTTIGTVGGTVLTVAVNIQAQDVLQTAILAAVGAVVSYLVSVGLRYVFPKRKDKN